MRASSAGCSEAGAVVRVSSSVHSTTALSMTGSFVWREGRSV